MKKARLKSGPVLWCLSCQRQSGHVELSVEFRFDCLMIVLKAPDIDQKASSGNDIFPYGIRHLSTDRSINGKRVDNVAPLLALASIELTRFLMRRHHLIGAHIDNASRSRDRQRESLLHCDPMLCCTRSQLRCRVKANDVASKCVHVVGRDDMARSELSTKVSPHHDPDKHLVTDQDLLNPGTQKCLDMAVALDLIVLQLSTFDLRHTRVHASRAIKKQYNLGRDSSNA